MKKTAIALAALAGVSFASAQEEAAPSYSLTLDNTIASEYIFRGVEKADVTFHPSLEVTYGNFYGIVWAALPEDSVAGVINDEIDFVAGYTFAIDDTWTLDVGATYYYYSGAASTSTFEPYVGISGDVGGFSLNFYGYYDTYIDDLTLQAGVGYSLPLEAIGTSLDFSATLGYVDGDGFENAFVVDDYFYYGVGVALPYALSETATVTAAVNYTDVSEDLINDGAEITFTVGLSIGF